MVSCSSQVNTDWSVPFPFLRYNKLESGFDGLSWQDARDKVLQRRYEMTIVNFAICVIFYLVNKYRVVPLYQILASLPVANNLPERKYSFQVLWLSPSLNEELGEEKPSIQNIKPTHTH